MPIYEYRCNACGTTFEYVARLSETKLSPTCPECSSTDTQKKISTFASSFSSSYGSSSKASSGGGCGMRGGFS